MKHAYLVLLLLLGPLAARSQSVGVGTSTPHSSAALEVQAADKGLLPPRLTAAQREGISSPAKGLLVYQTDGTAGYYYFSGAAWLNLSTGTQPEPGGTVAAPVSYGFVSTLSQDSNLGLPLGIAVDAGGTVYVAAGHRILTISPSGLVTALAGTGGNGFLDGPAATARFSGPAGLAVDGQGRVYVADRGNNRIRLIENGQVSTLAGSGISSFQDGPAASAQFKVPFDVAVDGRGRVYVADPGNHRIRLIENGQVTTLAGSGVAGDQNGPAATATFTSPGG